MDSQKTTKSYSDVRGEVWSKERGGPVPNIASSSVWPEYGWDGKREAHVGLTTGLSRVLNDM